MTSIEPIILKVVYKKTWTMLSKNVLFRVCDRADWERKEHNTSKNHCIKSSQDKRQNYCLCRFCKVLVRRSMIHIMFFLKKLILIESLEFYLQDKFFEIKDGKISSSYCEVFIRKKLWISLINNGFNKKFF